VIRPVMARPRFPLRVRSVAGKALFIGVGVVAVIALNLVLFLVDRAVGGSLSDGPYRISVLVLWVLCGRCFRGPGESLDVPRPWWRMTNRFPASAVFAVLHGVSLAVNVFWVGVFIVNGELRDVTDGLWWALISSVLLATLFISSAVNLWPRRQAGAASAVDASE